MRSAIAVALLVCGCGAQPPCPKATPPPTHGDTPQASPSQSSPSGKATAPSDKATLSWGPDGMGNIPARLSLCDGPSECVPIAIFYPPQAPRFAQLSTDERFVVFGFVESAKGPPDQPLSVHVYDAGTDTIVGRMQAKPNEDFYWTPCDDVLRTWSAGSDVSVAELWSVEGKRVLSVDGPHLSVAPDSSHLVIFATPKTPQAEDHDIYLYHLGKRSVLKHQVLAAGQRVADVSWSAGHVTLTLAGSQGGSQSMSLALGPTECLPGSPRRLP